MSDVYDVRTPDGLGPPRAATQADAVGLCALAMYAGEQRPTDALNEAAERRRFCAACKDPVQMVWVVDGPRLEGGLAAAVHVAVVADELEVIDVWVARPYRRRALGARLLCAVGQAAHARGARVACLEVRRGNVAARALYARLAFAPVGVRRGYYRPHPNERATYDVGQASCDALLLRAPLPLPLGRAAQKGA